MKIEIEAYHCDITGFSIEGFPGNTIRILEDALGPNEPLISILVPIGSKPGNAFPVPISVTHEGAYYETGDLTNATITVGSPEDPFIVVYALNGFDAKQYTVTMDEFPYGTWPPSAVWASFGLSGLAQPAGTAMHIPYEVRNGTLTVELANASLDAFKTLISEMKARAETSGTIDNEVPNTDSYLLEYTTDSSESFSLAMALSGTQGTNNKLTITIEPLGGIVPTWPSSIFASYGITGLSQPADTDVVSVIESANGTQKTCNVIMFIPTGVSNPESVFDNTNSALNYYFNSNELSTGDSNVRKISYTGKPGMVNPGTTATLTIQKNERIITLTVNGII